MIIMLHVSVTYVSVTYRNIKVNIFHSKCCAYSVRVISLGVGGWGRGVGGLAGVACNIARGDGSSVCARTLNFCILYFKYLIESILYFK